MHQDEKDTLIEKLKKENALLKKMVVLDPLTGLFNSRILKLEGRRFSAQALRNNEYICVIFTDIDKFKIINDLFGHDKGDAVLQKFAKILKNFFKRGEEIITRKSEGSDEFVCIWIATDLEATRAFIENVRKKLSAIPLEKSGNLTFSASVGFSYGNPKKKSLKEIMREADMEMYKIKEERKR